jgi:rare lipoprotein A
MNHSSSARPAAVMIVLAFLTGLTCSPAPRYTAAPGGARRDLPGAVRWSQEGIASYYADKFHGRRTANGETFDMHAMTAAHKTLPFNTRVRVTNLDNGRSVVVRINDRGPFIKDRIIDLSYGAARVVELIGPGTARVLVEVLEMGDG